MRAILVAIAVLFAIGTRADDAPARVFRAGAATSNITPPLGTSINGNMGDRRAAHIHDELHVRCLVLDNGETRLGFAVVDACMVPRELIDRAKAALDGVLKADNVSISATHTHEAGTLTPVFQSDPDPAYADFVVSRIVDGLQRAVNNLAPARIAWGSGQLPTQVFNRRWKMKPGSIPADPFGNANDQVRMNPPVGSADLIEPAGPTDPEISILAVQHASGEPLALLANYSLHYVGGEGPNHVSADYYGYFAEHAKALLEARDTEPPFVAMMTNATSGDCNNINFREARPATKAYEQMRRVGHEAAEVAVNAYKAVQWNDWVPLGARSADLQLGVRKPTEDEVTRAKQDLAAAAPGPLNALPLIYARETTLLASYPDTIPVRVQAFRIGALGIVQIPCEVFAEIGLSLKAQSALKPAFTIELANGYNGYLPTAAQHALGGYETWRARSSYLEVNAAATITETALRLLQELRDTP
jgi:neutral ceramidase